MPKHKGEKLAVIKVAKGGSEIETVADRLTAKIEAALGPPSA